MNLFRSIPLAFLICLAGLPQMTRAQENVTIPRSEYETLRRQAESARRLQAELDQVKAELARLRPATPAASVAPATPATPVAAPKTQVAPAPAAVPPASTPTSPPKALAAEPTPIAPQAVPAKSSAPFAPLPSTDAAAVLDVGDIIQHFALNPPAATAFYDGRKIRLQGVIAAFDKPAFRREFEVVFRTAAGQVVCRVAPPERYTAVFTTRSGAALTGRTERGAEVELLKVGDTVTVEGTGQGLKDGAILFTRSRVNGLK